MKSDFNSAPTVGGSSLAELTPGEEAVVTDVDIANAAGRRLLDLGLLPRTRVRALRRAPLGDPSLYELRGYRLCLRRADALHVRVERAATGAATTPSTADPS